MTHWSRSLCFIHAALALLLIGSEEIHSWHLYGHLQLIEDSTHEPCCEAPDPNAIAIDRWLDLRERTLHSLNIPASLVIGWYTHPLSLYVPSLAGSLLVRAAQILPVKVRVVVLDVLLLCAIALQWWLVGIWIERTTLFARFLKAVAASMTLLGGVMTFLAVPTAAAEVRLCQHVVEVGSLLLLLAWIIMIGVGILSLMRLGIRKTSSKRASALG